MHPTVGGGFPLLREANPQAPPSPHRHRSRLRRCEWPEREDPRADEHVDKRLHRERHEHVSYGVEVEPTQPLAEDILEAPERSGTS